MSSRNATKHERGGNETAPRNPSTGRWLWSALVLLVVWYLTGFPFSFFNPQWVEVKAEAEEASYGSSASSWREDISSTVSTDIVQWGKDNGIHPDTLSGAIKAASLERELDTGKPSPGTGYRVDMFDILGITSIETVLGQNQVDPTVANSTGGCIAWWELLKHKLLDGPLEVSSLQKTVEPLGYSAMKIYGSCGAGAIGWTQALPSNWWRLMGPGFNPWSLEDSAEFTARYLTTHRYFTAGRRSAVLSYNPGAGDSYVDPVIAKADSLRASFEASNLSISKTVVQITVEEEAEKLELPVQVERPTVDTEFVLSVFPVDGPPGSWEFGVPTWYQTSHTGIDVMSPVGTKVKSPGPGIVESTEWYPANTKPVGHGLTAWVFHGYNAQGEAVRSLTAHMSEFVAKPGDWVTAGQVLGYTGNTGAGSGPHAHIAIRVGGGCFQCEDQFAGHWEDPDLWINSGKIIYAEIPSGLDLNSTEQSTTSAMPSSIATNVEITLTLRRTPVLTSALWLGGKAREIEEAVEHLQEIADLIGQANSVAELILDAHEEIASFDSFLKSVGIQTPAQEFLENIQEADKLLERVSSVIDLLISIQKSVLQLHRNLSVWAIGGQPRELGLDPLLNWRLYPVAESK